MLGLFTIDSMYRPPKCYVKFDSNLMLEMAILSLDIFGWKGGGGGGGKVDDVLQLY